MTSIKYWAANRLLLGVEFDNKLFVDILGNIGTLRIVEKLAGKARTIPLKPSIVVGTGGEVIGDYLKGFRALADGDDITHFQFVGGDVDNIAVDSNMAVGHKLTGLGTAAGNTEPIDDVVKTCLDEFHEFFTSNTTTTGCLGIEFAELAL